jgi:hypothetical protein
MTVDFPQMTFLRSNVDFQAGTAVLLAVGRQLPARHEHKIQDVCVSSLKRLVHAASSLVTLAAAMRLGSRCPWSTVGMALGHPSSLEAEKLLHRLTSRARAPGGIAVHTRGAPTALPQFRTTETAVESSSLRSLTQLGDDHGETQR